MRAAVLKERPTFTLMKQTDIQNVYHMQMPRWLFSDPRYADMSLDAKVTYTFLLNRFQLSRRNGWINDRGEVFVIFPRKALAKELRICEQRVTAAFKKLIELELVWEKRCGRGDANQIYLAHVTPLENQDYESAPFVTEEPHCGSRTADIDVLDDEIPIQEPRNLQFKNSKIEGFRAAESEIPEPQKPLPSYKENSNKEEVSLSVCGAGTNRQADLEEEELMGILDSCELFTFEPAIAKVFENAIERLYFSDSFRIGNATLPQGRVRAKLRQLDRMILQEAEGKLHTNMEHSVKNSTQYIMVTIINCITECESDLMVDPYLNSMRVPSGRR